MFSRIQNLHISQTFGVLPLAFFCLVEFKIYISLKLNIFYFRSYISLVEFKIYISLKQISKIDYNCLSLVEFKIYISLKHILFLIKYLYCLVEFKIYISLKPQIEIWSRNFEFRYKKMDRHRSSPKAI